MPTLADMLGTTPIFAQVHPGHREQIASSMEQRTYNTGDVIVREGTPGDALFVVLNGRVAVTTRSEDLGITFDLARLGPGDYFGEMALLTEERRSATVTALEPTLLAGLSKALFDRILAQLPQVSLSMARGLALRMSQLNREQGLRAAEKPAPRGSMLPPGPARVRPQDITFLSPAEEASEQRGSQAIGVDAVTLLSQIVAEAVGFGASDIHIEADRQGLAVRHRVEGSLRRSNLTAPRSSLRGLVARVKALAQLDLSESRMPQNGRIAITAGVREIDLRVATIPTRMGEKVALRLLDSSASIQPLPALMVAEKMATALRKCLFRPYGAVVITGPTGSGKTTTLYSSLAERTVQGTQINIMTAEDPVEYYLPGITQVQINEAAGLTYPEALRAFLRQDPDILVIGETRDAQTARIALEAALTGHLVLTTMHTNDAMSAVVRLREMGLEPFLLSNALMCVVAQRLVRKLCPHCRKPGTYPPKVIENLQAVGALRPGEEGGLFDAVGCDRCEESGYKGRVGIFEMLLMDDRVREVIANDQPLGHFRQQLEGTGFVSLGRYAGFVLKSGLTTPGEVLRAVRVEQKLGG